MSHPGFLKFSDFHVSSLADMSPLDHHPAIEWIRCDRRLKLSADRSGSRRKETEHERRCCLGASMVGGPARPTRAQDGTPTEGAPVQRAAEVAVAQARAISRGQ